MLPQQQLWIECARRLTELQVSRGYVCYCREAPMSDKDGKLVSIHGNCETGEIFVEVTDDQVTGVESFQSRHKSYPLENRRVELPMVDTADAFALARSMCRRWPRPRGKCRTMNYGPQPTSTHVPPTKPQAT